MRTGHRKAILRFVRGTRSGIFHISSSAWRPPASCGMHASDHSPLLYMYIYIIHIYVYVYVFICICYTEENHPEGRRAEERECLQLKLKSSRRATTVERRRTSRNDDRTRSPRSLPSTVGFSRVLEGPGHHNHELILSTAGRERYGMTI